ncbi:MAG: TetR/AcrR family transcriptional regulator [Myxococcales bacterium]|nr:TetR/AcrR family transcriptional regulator [Myxococcales bacterium]
MTARDDDAPPTSGGPGRPRGRTAAGDATRKKLYATALKSFRARGYDETTLRDIAEAADVSPSLLYKYFPSKRAIVLELYEDLSGRYADEATHMKAGSWRDRFMFALETSLRVLGPHREALSALVPVLVGRGEESVFASTTSPARARVQGVFVAAVTEASDAPSGEMAEAMGTLLYVMHLGIILWWLLDRSPGQRATGELVKALHRGKPLAALGVHLPYARGFVTSAAAICRDGLFGEPAPGAAP